MILFTTVYLPHISVKLCWFPHLTHAYFQKFIPGHFIILAEIVNGPFLGCISQQLVPKHSEVIDFYIIYFVNGRITETSSLALIKFLLDLCPYFKNPDHLSQILA